MKRRLAGRVIVLDPDERVLLFRYDDGPPNGPHWSTPGGGLNPGESYREGAQRELIEETGWTDVPVGQELHAREIIMDYAGTMVHQQERLFLARIAEAQRPVLDVAGMHASDGIVAWHWWTLAELDTAQEAVWPEGLADLIRSLR
jgi:ADP-ribose pyrophosphatase YjhB (NUDIX family)